MKLPVVRSALPRPYDPEPSAFTRPFWDALARAEFLLARCGGCKSLQFPPRQRCPICLGTDVGWRPSAGTGTLYAGTRIHAAGGPFACMTPYSVGLIDLDEGVRILARLLHDASSLAPGSRVRLAVIEHTDGPLFAAVAGDDN